MRLCFSFSIVILNRHISPTITTNHNANNNHHQLRHNAKHATTTSTTPPPFNHLRHYASLQTPSSTDHATTLSASKRVRERGVKNRKKPTRVRGFSRLFLRGWCDEKCEAARSRLVDTRCEAVGVEKRPFSGNFSKRLEGRWSPKRGGAKGGAPSYLRRTDARLALLAIVVHARSLWSLVVSRLWWFRRGVVHLSLGDCGSCSLSLVFGGPLVFGGFAVLWFISLLARGPVVWFLVLWSDPFVGGVGR